MGLISSLNNAVSGLNVNQQNLSVLSQNISNANTPGYSAQVANQKASFIDGLPQGVSIASITRKVNEFLTAQMRTQGSTSNAASVTKNYYQQVENLLGQPGGTNSVDQNVNALFTALQNMANVPSSSAQTAVVNAATTLTTQISGLAKSVQNLRLQADTEISNSIASVNTDLKKLNSLNNSLERAAATNQNQAGLLDDRDAALQDLSQYMDITTLVHQDGSVDVNTTSGQTLVGTNLFQLSYTQAPSVQSFNSNSTLGAVTLTNYDTTGAAVGNPVTLVTGGVSGTNGSDSSITSSIPSGKLGALIQVRDKVLPQILAQFDQLASTMRDQVNQITNSGTSSPTPGAYTGERLVSGTQESHYSGSIRIAALNADGSAVASPYGDEPYGLQPLTLDLSTLDTGDGPGNVSTDGLINAVNQYFKQPQAKLELGNLNNVQLALDSSSVPANGNQLNFDFSLNNISNTGSSFFVTGATVQDSSGNTATATLGAPTLALGSYATVAGSHDVTVTTAGAGNLANGDTIYLPPPASGVGGLTTSQLSGYFTVSNVAGNSFTITTAGASAGANDSQSPGVSALTANASVGAGKTVRSGAGGSLSADLSSLTPNSPYYTVSANVASVDASGHVTTSTVTYKVGASASGARNTLFGAQSQTGGGTIVQPTSGGAILTASLVDASGNAVSKVNGVYGTKQGYLKIAANNGATSVAIDSLDSKQLGTPTNAGTIPGTNQGLSQYFGLNNFFKTNQPTATGDTLAGSALNFAVTDRIASNPSFISIGSLSQATQPADSTQAANYTYRMNSGDNSISQKLAGLSTQSIAFAAAGGLPTIGTTLSQYSGLIISQTSTNLTNASNSATDSQTLLDGYTKQASDVSGVNLDQELANTVIFQNAYTASTRVITVVSQLFESLLSIIQ